MIKLYSIIFLFLLNYQSDIIQVDVSNDIVVPKQYIITKTGAEIVIDGKANEAGWQNALFTDNFIDIEGEKQPLYNTRAKMLWDNNYIYIYAELEEPHIWANITKHDEIIYLNNDFEVFIDPADKAQKYGEIEINALGTILDLMLEKPYRTGGSAIIKWNVEGLKSAVDIKGTINDPFDTDSMWTVELAIPISSFTELKGDKNDIPKEGEQWRMNFSRVNWQYSIDNGEYSRKKIDNKILSEYNWVWSPQKVINMHEPEKWGIVQFSNAETSEEVDFINDADFEIKQIAFALFRKTRFGDLKYLMDEKTDSKKELNVRYSENRYINSQFIKTDKGFEYSLKSINSGKVYTINEEGVLISL